MKYIILFSLVLFSCRSVNNHKSGTIVVTDSVATHKFDSVSVSKTNSRSESVKVTGKDSVSSSTKTSDVDIQFDKDTTKGETVVIVENTGSKKVITIKGAKPVSVKVKDANIDKAEVSAINKASQSIHVIKIDSGSKSIDSTIGLSKSETTKISDKKVSRVPWLLFIIMIVIFIALVCIDYRFTHLIFNRS